MLTMLTMLTMLLSAPRDPSVRRRAAPLPPRCLPHPQENFLQHHARRYGSYALTRGMTPCSLAPDWLACSDLMLSWSLIGWPALTSCRPGP